jgi:hypothetical protein
VERACEEVAAERDVLAPDDLARSVGREGGFEEERVALQAHAPGHADRGGQEAAGEAQAVAVRLQVPRGDGALAVEAVAFARVAGVGDHRGPAAGPAGEPLRLVAGGVDGRADRVRGGARQDLRARGEVAQGGDQRALGPDLRAQGAVVEDHFTAPAMRPRTKCFWNRM